MKRIKKDVTCIVGKYTNQQGDVKNRYLRIGSILETKNGDMLKIDVIPVKDGGWDGWAFVNDPHNKNNGYPEDEEE